MLPHDQGSPDKSEIRSKLEALLARQGQADSEESVQKAIESQFKTPEDREEARKQYEQRKLNQSPTYTPGVVWYPIVAESAMTEFLPQGPPIARGSTSEVYICETRFSKITFIVKLLVHDRQHIMTSLAMRELQALIRRRHRNVVSVLDAGHLRVAGGQQYPYVAMEKLDGMTLFEWFKKQLKDQAEPQQSEAGTPVTAPVTRKQPVFTPTIAAEIVSVLADAIEFCHEDNVTHGDISPNNAMVCGPSPSRETLKLIDFGLSGLGGETPGYGDPAHDTGDHQCMVLRDVYSLGATLFFCATGQAPPSNVDPKDPTRQRLDQSAWLREHAGWVQSIQLGDKSFTMICQRVLSTNPETRYQSAQEFQEDLSDWLGDHPLRHVRKNGYKWYQKESLLWKRCWDKDDPEDQADIIARTAVFIGCVSVWGGIEHAFLVMNGDPPTDAGNFTNAIMLASCLIALVFVTAMTRWKGHSRKILEPLSAFVIACAAISVSITPAKTFDYPTWSEQITGGYCALAIVGILGITFGVHSPEWRPIRYFGWATLFLCFVARYLTEPQYADIAMPLILSACQGIVCFLFARRIWTRVEQNTSVSNT